MGDAGNRGAGSAWRDLDYVGAQIRHGRRHVQQCAEPVRNLSVTLVGGVLVAQRRRMGAVAEAVHQFGKRGVSAAEHPALGLRQVDDRCDWVPVVLVEHPRVSVAEEIGDLRQRQTQVPQERSAGVP